MKKLKKTTIYWVSELYKGNKSLDHVLAHALPCPYCLLYHNVQEVEWNEEDTFWAYMKCPDVGEVRVTFEFQDKFMRKENEVLRNKEKTSQ